MAPTKILLALVLLAPSAGASAAGRTVPPHGDPRAPAADAAGPSAVAAEEPARSLDGFRARLIELGRIAAESIPLDPHERDRARVQEVVARTACRLGDLERAEACAAAITTWRRGAVYGEIAAEWARRSDAARANLLIDRALAQGPRVLDWQRDRIRVSVARAQSVLGEAERVRELEGLVEGAERARITAVRAATATPEQFAAILADLRAAVASGSLDATAGALDACAELAAGIDGDEERWKEIDSVYDAANGKVARELYIAALLRLADVRLADGATPQAKALVVRAVRVRDEVRWAPESELPITADIARRLGRADGREAGVAELERGLASFKASEERVANVFRAQALRPAAEALAELEARDRAVEVYLWAIEAGALNPNARPRAEDLSQTCASLAAAGIEPDGAMWTRLDEIRRGLVAPW